MTFKEFIERHNHGTMIRDAAWRAYDIEHMAKPSAAKRALRTLGYKGTTSIDFADCAADYGLHSEKRCKYLLALWWTWTRIALGESKRGILRKTGNDYRTHAHDPFA